MAHVESRDSTHASSSSTTRTVDDASDSDNKARKRVRKTGSPPSNAAPKQESEKKPRQVRGKRGALKNLLDMPDDIMWEVFQHLEPYDLLRLARTTKVLRRFLLNSSSAPLWRTCRAKVFGLPNCPQDLSEPGYAHLMFELICHFCGTRNVWNVVIPARVRCCRKCGLEKFESAHRLSNYDSTLIDVAPQTLVHPSNAAWMEPSPKIYVDALHALQIQYNSFGDNTIAQAKWIRRKKREFKIKMKDADEIANFLAEDAERKRAEKEKLQSSRIEEILLRLEANDELGKFDLNVIYDHPSVSQPRKLTEQAWKKLEPTLIKFIREGQRKDTIHQFVWNMNDPPSSKMST